MKLIFRPDPKPIQKPKVKKQYRYKRKPTGEKDVFEEIWNERPHVSQISSDPISDPTPTNFLHVLPKAQNKYPEFKLYKQNIVLGTEDEHYDWDHNREAIKEDPKWNFMFELEASLLEQHKNLYP